MNWRDHLIKQFTKPNPLILENNYKILSERLFIEHDFGI